MSDFNATANNLLLMADHIREYGSFEVGELVKVMQEGAKEITSLKEQLAEREWVSVEDRLPEKGDLVITVSDHGDTSSLYSEYFEGTRFWSKAFNNITHWMPLPSPPTGEENG